MSYTAPQYVDTKEQAILALASTIADEDKSALGNGSVNRALDVLADVLAEQDVQVPQTDAGAILALADYVSGGGGGGGGGSSDFTTAHVTVAGIAPVSIYVCTFVEAQEGLPAATSPFLSDDGSLTYEFDALLYKGGACLSTTSKVKSTSGSITEIDDGFYLITGDCSIDGGK